MSAPVKNLRDGTLKVQVDNDGGGNAGEVEVVLDAGDLSWTESRPVAIIDDRGTLSHARRSPLDQLIELSFSIKYQDHLDPNSASPTVYEALTKQSAAASWVSQNFDSDDYAVNLEFTVADPAGGTAEIINFDRLNIISIAFAEGDPFNTLTVTATAPLYWVDFWWKAGMGLNPWIGSEGVFTRASTATYINSDGEIDYARSGEFRSDHHPASTGATGLLEAQRTNLATMSEDLGGADWAATNITVGIDDNVGPDGYTTAETLTASAGNGTLINDLGVVASAAKTFSIWLKRKAGVGDIDLTLNGGGAWTTKTITASWARYEITATVADPDVGIRIVTNADAVYAWGGQLEDSAPFASSYIPTTVYPLSPDGYFEFSGAAGNNATSPDAAVLDIVGDIDTPLRIAADDYTPTGDETLEAKWTEAGDQRSYRLQVKTTGVLSLSWSTDGAVGTVVTVDSSVALSTANGAIVWARATLDVSTGNVNFYTSNDGVTWTLLGAADQGGAGATSIFAGTAVLEIGSHNAGTAGNFAGKIYRAQVYDGIAGTLVFDADPQVISTHGVTRITLTEKANSAVVTTFATSAAATRVADNLYFPLPEAVSTPKEETLLARFVEKGSTLVASARVFHVGGATAASDPNLQTSSQAGNYELAHDIGATTASAIQLTAPSIDDETELRAVLSPNGGVVNGQSIAGATETNFADTDPEPLQPAWADTRLYLNSGGSTFTGFSAFREFLIARRTRTLNDLRKMG